MKKVALLLLSTALMAGTAYAGGSLFKHKSKTVNTNGVYSIGVHICSSLECPPVRIISGNCSGTNMTQHWGVCVCDKGYVADGSECKACPDGQYSDGIHGCTGCVVGTYRSGDTDTSCSPCPDGYYCDDGQPHKCPEYAKTCDAKGYTCQLGFTPTSAGCQCLGDKYIDGNTCKDCPEKASCDGTEEFTCVDGYQKIGDTCQCRRGNQRYIDNNGKCVVCDGYFDNDGNCQDCSDPDTPPAVEKCGRCPQWQMRVSDDECVYCDGPLDWDDVCHDCPEPGGIVFDVLGCGSCQNVFFDGTACISCTYNSYDAPVNLGECKNCPNREWEEIGHLSIGSVCYPDKCENGFRDMDGNCHSCTEESAPNALTHQCDKCSGDRQMREDQCVLKCEDGAVTYDGDCYSCTDPEPFGNIDEAECEERCPGREGFNGLCYPSSCGGFRGTDGQCHECDEPSAIDAVNCGNCTANREMAGGECICSINPETDCLSKALVDGECACAPVADGTECTSWSNNECGKGKYCVLSPTNCSEDPTSGICKPIGWIGNEKTATVSDHEYTMSDCSNCPDWWSAQSWCKAHNKTMVSLSDLHCSGDSGSCSDNLWEDLSNALYQHTAWMTDMWGLCVAAGFSFSNGTFHSNGRIGHTYNVLCR